jgi:hypothetical protein
MCPFISCTVVLHCALNITHHITPTFKWLLTQVLLVIALRVKLGVVHQQQPRGVLLLGQETWVREE